MNKFEKIIKENKKYIIVFLLIWLLVELLAVSPIAVSIKTSLVNGKVSYEILTEKLIEEISSLTSFTRIFRVGAFGEFIKMSFWTTIILGIFTMIGMFKSKPKGDYADIEHGSSDWSENGEQYRILNKKKGIVLAENNYLPLDKLGNINVMVVGRIWFW